MSDSEPDRGHDPDGGKSLLARVLGETAIITATTGLLFLSGYFFIDVWMNAFNVPIWAIDFPSYTPLIYAVIPVLNAALLSIKLLYAGALIILIANLFPGVRMWARRGGPAKAKAKLFGNLNSQMARRLLKPVAVIVLLIGALMVLMMLPNYAAKQFASDQYNNGTPIHLVFGANIVSSLEPELTKANDGGNLRLLIQTKDLVIVFEKPGLQPDKTKSVFTIKRADLVSVHTWSPPAKGSESSGQTTR
jgi:hypothetical protein